MGLIVRRSDGAAGLQLSGRSLMTPTIEPAMINSLWSLCRILRLHNRLGKLQLSQQYPECAGVLMKPLAAGDPRRIGPYRLHLRLGSGGMGRVFLGSSPAGRA